MTQTSPFADMKYLLAIPGFKEALIDDVDSYELAGRIPSMTLTCKSWCQHLLPLWKEPLKRLVDLVQGAEDMPEDLDCAIAMFSCHYYDVEFRPTESCLDEACRLQRRGGYVGRKFRSLDLRKILPRLYKCMFFYDMSEESSPVPLFVFQHPLNKSNHGLPFGLLAKHVRKSSPVVYAGHYSVFPNAGYLFLEDLDSDDGTVSGEPPAKKQRI